jgi:23S rRNA-/tRNA-specific pseudouridylate synthase
MTIAAAGRSAQTRIRVLSRPPQAALVECDLLTGRTHQIRVHLAASGTPILNDPFYGNATRLLLSDLKRGYKGRDDERPLIARLALHASALTLTHPLSRERCTIEAPWPQDFAVAVKYLRKFGSARRPPAPPPTAKG